MSICYFLVIKKNLAAKNTFGKNISIPTFAAAGLTRPAPAETPQGRNAARTSG